MIPPLRGRKLWPDLQRELLHLGVRVYEVLQVFDQARLCRALLPRREHPHSLPRPTPARTQM